MSCRILAQDEGRMVQRMAWTGLNVPGRDTAVQQTPAAVEEAEGHKLHNRIAELERALDSEVRQARERAFQEGQKAGRETAASEVQPVIERLLRACSDVATLRARIRRETESDIVTLTVAIARRVLRRELSVDPEAIHGIVKAALEKVQTKEICLVRVHPDHIAQVRSFLEKSGLGAGLEISPDPALQLGGLILETKRGNLDASVETQLKEIERGFTDRLGT